MSPDDTYRAAERALREGQVTAALPPLRQAADAGHPAACQRLAQYLLHFEPAGAGPEILQRLAQAREGGHPAGAYLSACVALGGVLLDVPSSQVARWLLEAAHGGLRDAWRAVAWLQAHAHPGRLDTRLLEGCAHAGDGTAAAALGVRQEGSPASVPLDPHELPDVARLGEALEAALKPPPCVSSNSQPPVHVFDDLLSVLECRLLMLTAARRLRPSTVHHPSGQVTLRDPIRTSADFSLDPLEEDFVLRWIQTRLTAAAGCRLVQAEHLVVLHYAPGQEYRPHRDDLAPQALAAHRPQAGQRLRTICAYLNPVERGGETEFPMLDVRIQPVPGRAIVFDNLDGSGRPEPRSLHAGRPVEAGAKWLATLWLRQGGYRDW